MVSKELQNKFYTALESLRDGKNDYILEALAAGAKATFEGLIRGEVTADGTYIPPKDERPDSDSIGPDSCSKFLTLEDLRRLTHDLDTENEENPEELNFDSNEAKRFPTYPGQFSEEENPSYSMVAEAIAKLGKAIRNMKTDDNASIMEAIHEGFSACFESSGGQEAETRFPIMFADEDDIEDAEVEKVKTGDTTALIEKLRAKAHPAGKGFARPEGRMFTEHDLADIIDMHARMVAQDEERGRFAKCILDDPNEKAWFFDDYNSEGAHTPWATYIKW
jgi:hypothetical protein